MKYFNLRSAQRYSTTANSTPLRTGVATLTPVIAPRNTTTTNSVNSNAKGQDALGLALCPVCFESKSEVSAIACGHVFCNMCVFNKVTFGLANN